MKRWRHLKRLLLVCVVTAGLTGCTPDLVEVDAINMVLALGVDEIGDKVRVSAEVVLAQGAQGGVQQKQTSGQYLVKESTGDSIESAVENLNMTLPRRTFLPHNTVVLFGKAYAEKGLSRAFDYLERDRTYRRNQLLLVTPGEAEEVLKQGMATETINALGLRQLVEQFSDTSPVVNSQQLRVMREYLQASHAAILTAVDIGSDEKPEISGVGLFQGGKLKTFLNRQQTEGLLWHIGSTRNVVVNLPGKNDGADAQSTFRLLTTHTQVTPVVRNGQVHVFYKMRGRGEVMRVCPNTKMDSEHMNKMELKLAQEVEACMKQTMSTLQENQIDAAQVANRLFQVSPRQWRAMATQWNDGFSNATVSYDIKIHLIRSGLSASEPSSDYSPQQYPPKAGKEPKVK